MNLQFNQSERGILSDRPTPKSPRTPATPPNARRKRSHTPNPTESTPPTTYNSHPVTTPTRDIQPSAPALTGRIANAATPIGVHTVADILSFVTVAMLPLLATRLALAPEQKALAIGLAASSSGLIQPVVAYFADKFEARWLGTLGLVLAALTIPFIGFAQNFAQLLTLSLVGVIGCGAFHPPAAAAVGALAGTKRSAALSVFFVMGMVGGMAGNVGTPIYVSTAGALHDGPPAEQADFGLKALALLSIPALAAALILARAIHRAPHRSSTAHELHHTLSEKERRARWLAVALLWFANIIRFTINNALVYLIVEWTERLTLRRNNAQTMTDALGLEASNTNGYLQAAMQLGMGGGGLLLGFFLARRFEKPAFIIIPILGALMVAAIPHTDRLEESAPALTVPLAFAITTLAGIGFGSLIPVSLSLGQRLLPHRTSLASGLLLGGAWGFAIIGPTLARLFHNGTDATHPLAFAFGPDGLFADTLGLNNAFTAAAAGLLVAALAAAFLPGKLLARIDAH